GRGRRCSPRLPGRGENGDGGEADFQVARSLPGAHRPRNKCGAPLLGTIFFAQDLTLQTAGYFALERLGSSSKQIRTSRPTNTSLGLSESSILRPIGNYHKIAKVSAPSPRGFMFPNAYRFHLSHRFFLHGRSRQRQLHSENRSRARHALHRNCSAMLFDDALCDGESKSGPGQIRAAPPFHSIEALEDPFLIFLGDPDATI